MHAHTRWNLPATLLLCAPQLPPRLALACAPANFITWALLGSVTYGSRLWGCAEGAFAAGIALGVSAATDARERRKFAAAVAGGGGGGGAVVQGGLGLPPGQGGKGKVD